MNIMFVCVLLFVTLACTVHSTANSNLKCEPGFFQTKSPALNPAIYTLTPAGNGFTYVNAGTSRASSNALAFNPTYGLVFNILKGTPVATELSLFYYGYQGVKTQFFTNGKINPPRNLINGEDYDLKIGTGGVTVRAFYNIETGVSKTPLAQPNFADFDGLANTLIMGRGSNIFEVSIKWSNFLGNANPASIAYQGNHNATRFDVVKNDVDFNFVLDIVWLRGDSPTSSAFFGVDMDGFLVKAIRGLAGTNFYYQMTLSKYQITTFKKGGVNYQLGTIPYTDDSSANIIGYTSSSRGFGSAFSDKLDGLYFGQNLDNSIWKVIINNNDLSSCEAEFVLDAGNSTFDNDGASCKDAAAPFTEPEVTPTAFYVQNNFALWSADGINLVNNNFTDIFADDVGCAGCQLQLESVPSQPSQGTIFDFPLMWNPNGFAVWKFVPNNGYYGSFTINLNAKDKWNRTSTNQKIITFIVSMECSIIAPDNGNLGTCQSVILGGTNCIPVCNAGYTLFQNTDCNINGSLTQSTCTPNPCNSTEIANSDFKILNSINGNFLDSVNFKCDEGYFYRVDPSSTDNTAVATSGTVTCLDTGSFEKKTVNGKFAVIMQAQTLSIMSPW